MIFNRKLNMAIVDKAQVFCKTVAWSVIGYTNVEQSKEGAPNAIDMVEGGTRQTLPYPDVSLDGGKGRIAGTIVVLPLLLGMGRDEQTRGVMERVLPCGNLGGL